MEYIVLVILIVCILAIVAITRSKFGKRISQRYDARGFDHNRMHKNGTKYDDYGFDYYGYDAKGYGEHGYNAFGKNTKGQYNRLFDTESCSTEGFLNPAIHPIALTDHARMRMRERLGINDYHEMDAQIRNAYQFGKSRRQLKKTSAYLVEEIEQRYEGVIILVYKNYIYVFTCENALKTVYKNDRIPL